MKYCVDYYKHIKGLDKADEYTIKYSNKMNILMDFLEENEKVFISIIICFYVYVYLWSGTYEIYGNSFKWNN